MKILNFFNLGRSSIGRLKVIHIFAQDERGIVFIMVPNQYEKSHLIIICCDKQLKHIIIVNTSLTVTSLEEFLQFSLIQRCVRHKCPKYTRGKQIVTMLGLGCIATFL